MRACYEGYNGGSCCMQSGRPTCCVPQGAIAACAQEHKHTAVLSLRTVAQQRQQCHHHPPDRMSGLARMGRDSILVMSMSRSANTLSALNSMPGPCQGARRK